MYYIRMGKDNLIVAGSAAVPICLDALNGNHTDQRTMIANVAVSLDVNPDPATTPVVTAKCLKVFVTAVDFRMNDPDQGPNRIDIDVKLVGTSITYQYDQDSKSFIGGSNTGNEAAAIETVDRILAEFAEKLDLG